MTDNPGNAFGQNLDKYQTFRPRPPQVLFDTLLEAVGPYRNHAVDLGAGTGDAAVMLLPQFERVTAVEMDPDMAETLVGLGGNIDVRVSRAEDMSFPEHSLDLVVCAMSFHWMDREHMASKVQTWLRPGGVFAVYGYGERLFPEAPVLGALIEGEQKNHWEAFLANGLRAQRNDQILGAISTFSIEQKIVTNCVEVTLDYLIGHLASVSIAAAYARSTLDPEEYWIQIKNHIADLDLTWPISMCFKRELLVARKATDSRV